MIPLIFAATAPLVTHVYPSSRSVPEALLRITIRFAAPQPPNIAERVRLRHADGTFAYAPFADPPLWSPDQRMLTLILDPSRQKIGLRDHLTYGFVLRSSQVDQLMLGDQVLKTWRVRAGTCSPLAPERWSISNAVHGTRRPIVVRFAQPIDALSADDIAVIDGRREALAGLSALRDGESVWTFTPRAPWPSRVYLALDPRLEDPCGDEIGEPFEHGADQGLGSDRHATILRVPRR